MDKTYKAYRLQKNREKKYDGKQAFVIPKDAKNVECYIDSLYNASKKLSPAAIVEGADIVADAMISDIINSKDSVISFGKTYYISNYGSDDNDGLSPESAWATTDKLHEEYDNLCAGDVVLFERGCEWRKHSEWELSQKSKNNWNEMCLLKAKQGVKYGAYGNGPKPILNGSAKNYANEFLWKETNFKNVYVCTDLFWNAGIFALDHTNKLGVYDERNAFKEIVGRNFEGIKDLNKDCSYFLDMDTHKLYFYSEFGNPGNRFNRIEIGGRLSLVKSFGNSYIENFHFKFDGYGIIGGPSINIKNCIFSYIGGCLAGDKNGKTNVCGNAVEIYGACDGFTVENCWIYQMCDTGVSHQLWTDIGECIQKNISFKGNIIEYCHWGIEFNNPPSSDGTKRLIENCEHSYNVVRNGGKSWADIQLGRQNGATLYNCFGTGKCINTICKKNIFNQSTGLIYRMRFEGDKSIKYYDNINIQKVNHTFAYLYDSDYLYDETAEVIFKKSADVGDGIYIYLE